MTVHRPAPLPARPLYRIDALEPAQRSVIWAFRHWIAGHARRDTQHWLMVVREFTQEFGHSSSHDAVAALATMVGVLCNRARKNFAYHQPCCPCLSSDEYRVAALIAACREGHWGVARVLAEWLVLPDGRGDLIDAACRLNGATGRPPCDAPFRIAPYTDHLPGN